MNDLLKQLGEIEIQFKLLDAKKTALVRKLLEMLKNEQQPSAATTETRETKETREKSEAQEGHQP